MSCRYPGFVLGHLRVRSSFIDYRVTRQLPLRAPNIIMVTMVIKYFELLNRPRGQVFNFGHLTKYNLTLAVGGGFFLLLIFLDPSNVIKKLRIIWNHHWIKLPVRIIFRGWSTVRGFEPRTGGRKREHNLYAINWILWLNDTKRSWILAGISFIGWGKVLLRGLDTYVVCSK